MSYETIIYRKADEVARITLNRAEMLNELNRQMLTELPKAIAEVVSCDDVRV